MARIPQPIELAEFKGADRKNPQRYRKSVPKSGMPLGNAPAHLSPEAQSVWFELEAYSLPGVLTGADRLLFEIASNLMAEYREDPKGFTAARIEKLVGCLARLGMSPADRQKLGVEKDAEEDNAFNDF